MRPVHSGAFGDLPGRQGSLLSGDLIGLVDGGLDRLLFLWIQLADEIGVE